MEMVYRKINRTGAKHVIKERREARTRSVVSVINGKGKFV